MCWELLFGQLISHGIRGICEKEIMLKMSRSRGDDAVCTLPLTHWASSPTRRKRVTQPTYIMRKSDNCKHGRKMLQSLNEVSYIA